MTLDLRKIDALVAEHVFGCHVQTSGPSPTCGCDRLGTYPFGFPHGDGRGEYATELKLYSAYISDAWEVVEKLQLAVFPNRPGEWDSWQPGGVASLARADTAPLAICLAALKVRGIAV